MIEKISEDIKNAMKSKEKERLNALRYLKSMLLENKTSKAPKPDLDVTAALQKKLKDSIQTFPENSPEREQLAKEIAIIGEYLPKPLERDDVIKLIQEIKEKLTNPNMGMVMKELTPQIKGRFDGKEASQLVTDLLK